MLPATEHELHQELGAGRIVPFAQPMSDIVSGRIVGFDCTLRRLVPGAAAAEPLPGIRTQDLCWLLVERLLGEACATATTWPDHLALSIDLPAPLLADRSMPARLASLIADSHLPASRLVVGITERCAAGDHEAAVAACMQFRALGMRTVLAAYDGRHCTLAQLSDLALDRLRIDAGIVGAMGSCFQGYRIAAAALGLGRGLDLTTMATGIENRAQADMLAMLGCDIGQGDRFGAAVRLQHAIAGPRLVRQEPG